MSIKQIPFLDLVQQNSGVKQELLQIASEIIDQAAFIGGPQVTQFEAEFAKFVGAPQCIGMSNGTDALRLALIAMGIGKGDRVVTVPNTFIATTEAISQSGAEFDFVDVDQQTSLMDPTCLEDFLKKNRVAAVVPVHLYGQCADMDSILTLSQKYGFKVLEDAAQAHGASYKGRPAGTMGEAAGFSFYPGKNLGACGEAGAVTTTSPDIAAKIKMLRDHGQSAKYYHDLEGYNCRLDALQAGFLRVKLKHLAQWNEQRRKIAALYDEAFSSISWIRPVSIRPGNISSQHLYVIHVEKREELQQYLKEKGVQTGLHYPIPLHLQKCYSNRSQGKGSFPVAEKLAAELVTLPMYAELKTEDVLYIIDAIKKFPGANQ
jgi:dTDP-4-amino-4,6-dideoxygalactose transaminase